MARLTALIATLCLLAACDGGAPTATETTPQPSALAVGTEADLPDDNAVNLKVYFRSGTGATAHLVAVEREVPIRDDLPRQALELLLAGPVEGDGRDLQRVLPASTRILGLRVDGDLAHVDLSEEVLTDARDVASSPEAELLALAALANTLTEFPAIDRIRLTVGGEPVSAQDPAETVRAFWGGWGLPEILVRDESVVGPPREGEGMPELGRFSLEPQEAGDDGAPGVQVTSVRTRDRTTYLRLVVEVADAATPESPSAVPPTRAVTEGDAIVLELDGVAGYDADFGLGQRVQFNDPSFHSVEIEQADLPGTARFRIIPTTPRQFRLHLLSSPTRVVLDVRK